MPKILINDAQLHYEEDRKALYRKGFCRYRSYGRKNLKREFTLCLSKKI
jgi:hypothetical protein